RSFPLRETGQVHPEKYIEMSFDWDYISILKMRISELNVWDANQPAGLPAKQGLYDPQFEHDSCGVGFVVNIKGRKSHEIVRQALNILLNLRHRGACGCEANTGDGAGILLQMPHLFLKEVCREAEIQLP